MKKTLLVVCAVFAAFGAFAQASAPKLTYGFRVGAGASNMEFSFKEFSPVLKTGMNIQNLGRRGVELRTVLGVGDPNGTCLHVWRNTFGI